MVKSVLRSIAPDAAVIDVTHNIKPYDVRAGGLALARSANYLVPGVVLAVVDPGVASDRRAVAVEVGGGESVLVGPDNGLLAPAVALVGGASRAVDITNSPVRLAAPGPTFDGRDLFAPVAAHLAAGRSLDEVGEPIDPMLLMPAVIPVSGVEGDAVLAEVLWIDRYGNAQLNVGPDDVQQLGNILRMKAGDRTRPLRRVDAYEAVAAGQVGLILDSSGLLALSVNRGSAAAELGLLEGDSVRIMAADDDGNAAVSTPIELKPRTDRPGAGGR